MQAPPCHVWRTCKLRGNVKACLGKRGERPHSDEEVYPCYACPLGTARARAQRREGHRANVWSAAGCP
jgi:hypothetical protein